MLNKRLIVCLDVRAGKVTKGIRFAGNVDLGDPVEMAREYAASGVDELVFYDITASAEDRAIDIAMVEAVAKEVFVPYCVGGGLRDVDDMRAALTAGADKVSINSLAVTNPQIIADGAKAFGNQCIVLGMDVLKVEPTEAIPSGYEVVIRGGRQRMGWDAVAWAQRAEGLGAGEVVLNSIDADGTREGYELSLTRQIADAVGIPVIASGGAGVPQHLIDVLTDGHADAALVASMVHYGDYTVPQIKQALHDAGVPVRMDW